jgi:beta-lactamase superfamily II metal-dependent hydrolase
MTTSNNKSTSVAIRMYNMGFGDAFRIDIHQGSKNWRMLVDCGVHLQGSARPLAESVAAIIADLAADSPGGRPHLDVIVATHHHYDHIAGFADSAWEAVEVGEVWVPFVEDASDPTAARLRRAQTDTAKRLLGLLASRTHGLEPDEFPPALQAAQAFALNSLSLDAATDRLLGRNGSGFAGGPAVRFLPAMKASENIIGTGLSGVQLHVLGPPRDPEYLKWMNPPANAGWLTLDSDLTLGSGVAKEANSPLFNDAFVMDNIKPDVHTELMKDKKSLDVSQINNDAGLLAAAAILERVVNNTSVFFVLDVDGQHFVFPGDSQQGAWEHVLEDESTRALVSDAVFYKIGHHGSHNGTPKRYIEQDLHDGGHAMLPFGPVKQWKLIPKAQLLDALKEHHHVVTRADAPVAVRGKVTVHEGLWSEITFSVPPPGSTARKANDSTARG